jgi:hypothetical protein
VCNLRASHPHPKPGGPADLQGGVLEGGCGCSWGGGRPLRGAAAGFGRQVGQPLACEPLQRPRCQVQDGTRRLLRAWATAAHATEEVTR